MIAVSKDEDFFRLAGTAERMAHLSPKIDEEYFGRAEESISKFIFQQDGAADANARKLVSAGLISPNDPMAIALHEEKSSDVIKNIPDRRSLNSTASDMALGVSKGSKSRDTSVSSAALFRRIKSGNMPPQAIASGFEGLVRRAEVDGDMTTASSAARGFAHVAVAGVAQRDRARGIRRDTGQEER